MILNLLTLVFIFNSIDSNFGLKNDFDNVTSQFDFKNGTRVEDSKEPVKTTVEDNDGSLVYLDDVLLTLKSQVWGVEEEQCLDHIYRMLYSLQNFTLWAVWDWDAQSPEPQGLLFGNKFQLGNFDQCMHTPWSDGHPELRTKYCLAAIELQRIDKSERKNFEKPHPYQSALDFIENRPPQGRRLNQLIWGICVPASCAPRTVERLLGVMLARSHLGAARMRMNITAPVTCQDPNEPREYDWLFYTFFGVAATLVTTSLICTYLNCRRKELTPNTAKTDFIQAFCLKENALELLRMKKEGIEVFYGIRFLTICLIVTDHLIGIANAGPTSDGIASDEKIRSLIGLFLLHDDLFVDTFFLLSGFLTVTTMAKFKKLPNPIFIILKRYVRLVVALAVVVFYMCAVFPHTGTGPLWNMMIAYEMEPCRENWWLNLLMLSNYVNTEKICIIVSWYIPCDFHCFAISILVYFLYKKHRSFGLTLAALLTTGSIIVPGIINYIYRLSAVQLFTQEFVSDPRANKEFHIMYIPTHTRFAAYLVGFYSGYLFVTLSANGNFNRIKQKWSVVGTITAIVVMFAVMLLGSTFLWRDYHPLESAIYAALNRPAWAAAVALLVMCCSFGHVPLVKSFLSWYPWVPLSRLAYGLYLTHSVIITRNVFVTRNPQHNDYFDILTTSIGVIFWGCIAALMLWLLAEAPANKLLNLCLKPRVKKFREDMIDPTSISASSSTSTVRTGSHGHLQDNLPATILYSSKI